MKKLIPLNLVAAFLLTGCFSPSQDQVDKAVQKEMLRQTDEKKRVYGYIDDYVKEKGGLPVGQKGPGGEPPKPSIDEQLKKPKRVELGESPVKGYRNAKVTIYEFSDFQCPFCQQVNSVIDNLMQKYAGKVKLVYKFLPLPMHPEAKISARAAVAAQKQGKFWEMHDKMFANQTALKRENLIEYAKQLGLDVGKFEKDMDSPKTIQRVDNETREANQIGLGGTPSFIINGVELVGAQPESEFTNVIDIILKK